LFYGKYKYFTNDDNLYLTTKGEHLLCGNEAKLSKQVLMHFKEEVSLKLNRLGLVFLVLGLTLTTVACGSKKTADKITGADKPSAIISAQHSNENTKATPSPSLTAKPSTSAPETTSPAAKASSKITSGEQAGELVKKTILNNNDGIAMAYNDDIESYKGFQCYKVKASSKAMQANGGSGTIGFYDVEIESGRIWDLATNKIAIAN